MIDFLVENPFVLLFLVLGSGYLLGKVRVAGFGLGVSAVLFVGLAFGALSPRIALPELIYQLGLILFVYTVGVAAGPGFLATLRRRALGANLLIVAVLVSAALLALGLGRWLGLSRPLTAGVYTGATTNTPALAAVLQHQEEAGGGPRRVTEPVLGYSVAYPFGVLGMVVAIWAARRRWEEAQRRRDDDELIDLTVRVVTPPRAGRTVSELMRAHDWSVVVSRVRRGDEAAVPAADFVLRPDDLVVVVGPADAARRVASELGERWPEELPLDRSELDVRRMFVSASEPIGQRIADLRLAERFGAIVTRVRRGDVDRLARPDMVLEPGDRVRVVAPRERMPEVTRFFGDSYRILSEIDVAAFSLGIVGGLLLGLVPVPLPGGSTFRLGMAGGPLVVGLVLGALERTGPITWQLPYNANLTLRQAGAVLFLAGVGIASGHDFATTVGSGDGLLMLGAGAAVTTLAALLAIGLGRVVLHVPVDVLCGMVAGMQTQPAVLAFAVEQAGDDLPNTGYAAVYPVATVAKIVLAQVLLIT
ncbi:MAG: aspartate:alanine exchanger family transporter [Candidatus Velamenicoccus archaeovorus]